MIHKDRYNYTSGHPSRAGFRRRIWVPLLLGALLAACDTGGAGGVPTTKPEVPTEPTPPPKPKAWHVSTFAGGGAAGTDGIGAAAGFGTPYGIVQIGDTFYVTDRDRHSIRTIDTNTAEVGTIVPANTEGGHKNGAARSARFNQPRGAVEGADGKLYIADFQNHRIRAVDLASSEKTVTTIAGSGTAGYVNGAGTAAQFNGPAGLALSGDTLYVADYDNDRIRAVDLVSENKTVTTIAVNSSTDAHLFNGPISLALSDDTLYLADHLNHRIKAIVLTTGIVTTIAGGPQGYADGAGTDARFNGPAGLALSGDTLYVADYHNHRIRAMDIATKRVRTIAGTGTKASVNGIGTAAQVDSPFGIVASGDTLYVTSRNLIRKLEYK